MTQLKINTTSYGGGGKGKRDANTYIFDSYYADAAGWVPFEITGMFYYPYEDNIEFSVEGKLVGYYGSSVSLRTYSKEKPLAALFSYSDPFTFPQTPQGPLP